MAQLRRVMTANEVDDIMFFEPVIIKSEGKEADALCVVLPETVYVIPMGSYDAPVPVSLVGLQRIETCASDDDRLENEELAALSMRITLVTGTGLQNQTPRQSRSRSRSRENASEVGAFPLDASLTHLGESMEMTRDGESPFAGVKVARELERARLEREGGEEGEDGSGVVDVFTVQRSSKLLFNLERAWASAVMRASLRNRRSLADTSVPASIRRKELKLLFLEITHEIMEPKASLAQRFASVEELSLALEHDLVLTTFFWEDEQLFLFVIDELEFYLADEEFRFADPAAPNRVSVPSRENELEYCIVLVQLIHRALVDARGVPGRLALLTRDEPDMDDILRIICRDPSEMFFDSHSSTQSGSGGSLVAHDHSTHLSLLPFDDAEPAREAPHPSSMVGLGATSSELTPQLTLKLREYQTEVGCVLYELFYLYAEASFEEGVISFNHPKVFSCHLDDLPGFVDVSHRITEYCPCQFGAIVERFCALVTTHSDDDDMRYLKAYKLAKVITGLAKISREFHYHLSAMHSESILYIACTPDTYASFSVYNPLVPHLVVAANDLAAIAGNPPKR